MTRSSTSEQNFCGHRNNLVDEVSRVTEGLLETRPFTENAMRRTGDHYQELVCIPFKVTLAVMLLVWMVTKLRHTHAAMATSLLWLCCLSLAFSFGICASCRLLKRRPRSACGTHATPQTQQLSALH